ncbi:MAG: sulfite exporter TauE/SafE family protein, partial [Candidatus Bathyarchaeota archaeon]
IIYELRDRNIGNDPGNYFGLHVHKKDKSARCGEYHCYRIVMSKLMVVAIFAGFAKGFFGIGWGPFVIGLLVLLGVKPQIAVGSSLAVRLLIDCLGGISYASMNLVDVDIAVVLTVAGAITAVPAIKLATRASEKTSRIILGGVITLLGALVTINALTVIP